ncbi:MAG: hypothetical protein VX498_11320 [Myxococcota bacterium]|nr:hypothetical protein [Myxococcota bacterium]
MRAFSPSALSIAGMLLLVPMGALAEETSEESSSPVAEEGGDSTAEDRRASTSRALLLWGPSSLDDDGTRATQALKARIPAADPFPSRSMRISDWLGAEDFRIGGSGQAVECEPLDAEPELTLGELVVAGREALDNLEAEEALKLFRAAELRIPCQSTFLDRETHQQAFFYGGIAAFFTGQTEEAARLFRQSATINPNHDWDRSYPPDPQSTFLSAVQDVIARPKVRVYGDIRNTRYLEVRLDGEMLDRTKAFERTIYPGTHLIQAVDGEGNWTTFMQRIDEGGTITFFSARGAEQMLLEGPDSVLKSSAEARLSKRARDEGLDEIYLVTLDPKAENQANVIRFVVEGAVWTRLDRPASASAGSATTGTGEATTAVTPSVTLSPAERRKQALLRQAGYRTSTTFGFKYTRLMLCPPRDDIDGRCPDGRDSNHDYLGGLVGIDIRLIRGLNLDFRFGASFTDHKLGGTLLPEFGGGLRYRFLTGSLQPFVALHGNLLVGTNRDTTTDSDEVTLYGGLVTLWGIDIEFDDGFRLTFEGGAGVVLGGEGDVMEWPTIHTQFALGRFLP